MNDDALRALPTPRDGFLKHLRMENPQTLRDLAEWYRNFAEVGRTDQREARLKMAEHLLTLPFQGLGGSFGWCAYAWGI
jgi:hypothetical protein